MVAVRNSSGSKPPSSSGATHGAPSSSIITTMTSTTLARLRSTERIWSSSSRRWHPAEPDARAKPSAWPSSVAYSLSTGTSAALSIPPMSSSYTILGTLLTASKAAVPPLTPKMLAMTPSRTNPSRRLPRLPRALIPAARAIPAWALVAGAVVLLAGAAIGSVNVGSNQSSVFSSWLLVLGVLSIMIHPTCGKATSTELLITKHQKLITVPAS